MSKYGFHGILKTTTFNRRLLKTLQVVVALLASAAVSAEFTGPEQRMIDWIDVHAEDANALLAETVNIGSGTMNHEGVREVGRVMRRELDALGLDTEWIELPPEMNRAGHLFGRKDGTGRKFLLIGPMVGGIYLALAPLTQGSGMHVNNAWSQLIFRFALGLLIGQGLSIGMELADLPFAGHETSAPEAESTPST